MIELHLLHIFNLLIKDHVQMVPLLTSMKFLPNQASLMLILLLSFYSYLHLLLFLAPLRIDWLPWQLVGHVPLN